MKSEHFGEHLVNTLVNTLLREVNTMNSLRVYTHFSNIKIKVYKGNVYTYVYMSSKPAKCSPTEENCSRNPSQSVHSTIHFWGGYNANDSW